MLGDNINNLTISKGDDIVYLSHPKSNLQNQGIQVEPKSFSSAFAGLRLSCDSTIIDNCEMLPPEKPVQTSPRCPCGCLEHGGSSICGFRTRELSSMRLVVQGPEILDFQGTKQAPEDVAPYWKKDSRMWLWKSVRLGRRSRIKTRSSTVSDRMSII